MLGVDPANMLHARIRDQGGTSWIVAEFPEFPEFPEFSEQAGR